MRVLVVSDIHGNIEALRAVVAAEPGVDQVLCLGDSVDYGPAPDEVVSWVRHHASAGCSRQPRQRSGVRRGLPVGSTLS